MTIHLRYRFVSLLFLTVLSVAILPSIALAEMPNCGLGGIPEGDVAAGTAKCTYDGGLVIDVGTDGKQITGSAVQTPVGTAAYDGKGKPNVPSDSCSLLSGGSFWDNCVWIPAMSAIGGLFMFIGAVFVRLSGFMFNMLVQHVIIDFKSTLDVLQISPTIDVGWTVFRDLANIFIVGFFTFIAIAIILGLEEYGRKRLIVNVLVVAILINFSLLFAKVIIDASNFTAYQIYQQMAKSPKGDVDIASAFMTPMGLSSVYDSRKAVADFGYQAQSGLQAFAFGFVGGAVLLVTAIVLAYGCLLIASRAILFVFLMLTAAIAFATYLVPDFAKGKFGWSNWWRTLINNAMFAPLLMVFLALSVAILNRAAPARANTLGQVITDPSTLSSGSGWSVVMVYILGIGLLYISLQLSSRIAHSISGFSYSSIVPASIFAAGARMIGWTGRQTIGRPALGISDRLQKVSNNQGVSMFTRRLADFGAQRFKSAAGRDFNAMKTSLGSTIAKTAGLRQDALAGKNLGGFKGTQDAYVKSKAEQARRMGLSPDEIKTKTQEGLDETLRENAQIAQQYAETEQHAKERKDSHSSEQDKYNQIQKQHAEEMKRLQDALASAIDAARAAPADASAQNEVRRLEQQIANRKTQQNAELSRQSDRIRTAKVLSDDAEREMKKMNENLKDVAVAAGNLPSKFDTKAETAEKLAKSFTAMLFKSTGLTPKSNEKLAKLTAKEVGKQEKKTRVKEEWGDALKEVSSDNRSSANGNIPPSNANGNKSA